MRDFDHDGAREAWVRTALSAVPGGSRLLDAGAGEQPYRDACAHLAYVSQDFAAYDGTGPTGLHVEAFDATGVDIVCDIAAIPEPDGSFDAVLCTEVLEHVPDPLAALDEMARLVRPGGVLLVTAPFISLTHFAPYHYATGFSRYWYEHHLPARGFDIEEVTPNGDFFSVLGQEVRRLADLTALGKAQAAARMVLLRTLGRLSGHSDLLCQGWFVRARKQ